MTPTWDILICSIEHRTDMLAELLDELGRQIVPGVGVHVYRDNLEASYTEKCQRLLDSSTADYVSYVDDDDAVAEDYVQTIVEALQQRPDYVGFNVLYTVDGVPQMPALHSLKYDGWINTPDALYRDISHLNPIRRDLAAQSAWIGRTDLIADAEWVSGLRQLGCVKTEVYVDRNLYHYRYRPGESFVAFPYAPMVEHPPRPDHGFVTWMT